MDKGRWDRLAPLGGVMFAIAFIVFLLIAGEPPKAGDPASDVVSFFTDNRGSVLTGSFIVFAGVLAMLWFVGSLVTAMREAGEERLAVTALASFLLAFALGGAAVLMRAALAFDVARTVDANTAKGLYETALMLDLMTGVVFAGFAFAVAAAAIRTSFVPRAWGYACALIGLLFVVSGTAWSESGFWSPTGGLVLITNVAFLAFVLGTSVFHFRAVTHGETRPMHRTAAAH